MADRREYNHREGGRMNGIHDMGGMHGFGPVKVELNEPVFHAAWEARVLGMVFQVVGFGWTNIDAFRHAIERTPPVAYLTLGYYGRWLTALERVLVDSGALAPGDLDAQLAGQPLAPPAQAPSASPVQPGFVRAVATAPRFAVGQAVRARVESPGGHTRLPRYIGGRRGVVDRIHPACVFPDSNAMGRGEDPRHLYNVRFDAAELWGSGAEADARLHIDLFEPYLEALEPACPDAGANQPERDRQPG